MNTPTTWNLKLLYKNDTDPQIELDIRSFEKGCASFEKKYKKSNFTQNSKSLRKALDDYYGMVRTPENYKSWWYFALKTSLNSDDSYAGAISTKYMQRITEANNTVEFFTLEIAKIPKSNQANLLIDTALMQYQYKLRKIFAIAKHNLSEGEEQLASLLSQTSYDMWTESQEKVLHQQTISYKGKQVPLTKIIGELSSLPKKERELLQGKINTCYKSLAGGVEAELNAIYNFKKVMDERRGFLTPFSSTVLSNENDEKSVELLTSLVTKHFSISHRFYKLHAKLLGEKKLSIAHRNAPIGKIKTKFSFESSVAVLKDAFEKIDPEYVTILDRFVKNGQIDVYPKKGKRGGAFCWGMRDLPTFVLLNHTNDSNSVETFAHEMGHAIHTEMSSTQPPQYDKYSTATAEVASTFFEQVVSNEMESKLSKKELVVSLHNRILGDISTIFRQVGCFNFELELHQLIRERGQVPKNEIADLMAKHLRSYLGPSVSVTHDDGYGYVSWSHLRNFFYVYTYAYGQLVSRALFQKWKEDDRYAIEIKKFLKAGKSMSPEDIFKSIGIDTSKPEFFETGLKSIEQDIIKLEQLTKK